MCLVGAGATIAFAHTGLGTVSEAISVSGVMALSRTLIDCPIRLSDTGAVFRNKKKGGIINHESFTVEIEVVPSAFLKYVTAAQAVAESATITLTLAELTAAGNPATYIGTGDLDGLSLGDIENETPLTATISAFWDGATDPAWTNETDA